MSRFGIFRFIGLIIALILCSCADTPEPPLPLLPQPIQPAQPAPVPQIQEPAFSIISIKILQAELVNTRLKVQVRIDNPNPFPVTLSSFSYELYGEGRFWADGRERNVSVVPAENYAEKDLYVVMNFTDMRRDLLDKVIAMEMVPYLFKGTVVISAPDMPLLTKDFNLEGSSEVSR